MRNEREAIDPRPNDLCPCKRTSKRAKDCHWRDGHGWVIPAQQPRLGEAWRSPTYQHPDCYAHTLLGCSKRITKEHSIGEGALLALGDPSQGFTIRGLPGANPEHAEPTTIAKMSQSTLCTRHNNMLGPYDDALALLTKTVIATDVEEDFVLLNGHDVERALLKAFCGMLASGQVMRDGVVIDTLPRKDWLEFLYGRAFIPSESGLYVRGPADGKIWTGASFERSGLFRDDGELAGFRLNLAGIPFDLSLTGKLAKQSTDSLLSYRPARLTFVGEYVTTTIVFYWDEGGGGDRLLFDRLPRILNAP